MTNQEALKAVSRAAQVKIAKLKLAPGDYLVVRVPADMLAKMAPFAEPLQKMIPKGCRVIVMSDDCDLTVITRTQLASAAEQVSPVSSGDANHHPRD